jgi:hypothetical protein
MHSSANSGVASQINELTMAGPSDDKGKAAEQANSCIGVDERPCTPAHPLSPEEPLSEASEVSKTEVKVKAKAKDVDESDGTSVSASDSNDSSDSESDAGTDSDLELATPRAALADPDNLASAIGAIRDGFAVIGKGFATIQAGFETLSAALNPGGLAGVPEQHCHCHAIVGTVLLPDRLNHGEGIGDDITKTQEAPSMAQAQSCTACESTNKTADAPTEPRNVRQGAIRSVPESITSERRNPLYFDEMGHRKRSMSQAISER